MKSKIEWCPGCGNFGVLKAFRRVIERLESDGVERGRIVSVAGIGCHGRMPDYLDIPTFHTIHGRVLPLMTGIKLANPELLVSGFSGDGDALNEGMEHFVHAAKRNTDVALFLHNNQVFGLTTGQFTATTPRGKKTRTTPAGNPEWPINPALIALVSGATFIARGFAGNVSQLSDLMYGAIRHRGFAFVEILQPCITFNNTWDHYRENVYVAEPAESFDEAVKLVSDEMATGLLFRTEKQTFEETLLSSLKVPKKVVKRI
ncbi:thiamine pyrophosphate-dependent enzyme [Geoglobus acetivorans]|uniref:Thiamine pyrophosphate-dependent enzyme n=1 Tax=Geoglobus acetivorans TaxID=565033 RepID=A0ABZ3H509_GEOAI|nr:2-oxoacid:ferredoxin oxidoreductase subunit beta [Geoglobus acetivorans]